MRKEETLSPVLGRGKKSIVLRRAVQKKKIRRGGEKSFPGPAGERKERGLSSFKKKKKNTRKEEKGGTA